MDTSNTLYNFGDGNIDLQNIVNSSITVNYNSDLKPEIKEQKKGINHKIEQILKKLAEFERLSKLNEKKPQLTSNDLFEDVEWDDLVEAIEHKECVIFIGPEISIDEHGDSLHEKFNRSISSKKLEYDAKDGFFMPGADKTLTDKQIKLKVMSYYKSKFDQENILGYQLIENIAKIPFPLIVSVTPDEIAHKVFESNAMPHTFHAYNAKEQKTNLPTIDKPVIYNLLGSPVENGIYIFTHEHFYNYMKQSPKIRVPENIKNTIGDAIHYLFIGIDFNKWYNRLLMFSLDVQAEGFSCHPVAFDVTNKTFIEQQFKITSVKGSYDQFIDKLLGKCYKRGLYKPLYSYFIEQAVEKTGQQRIAAKKTENEGELQEINNSLDNLLDETIKKTNDAQ